MKAWLGLLLIVLAGCGTVRVAPVFDPTARILHAEPEDVVDLCWARGSNTSGVAACYDPGDDTMILPFESRVGQVRYRELYNHEECHRLGWGGDHGERPKGCR